VDPWVPARPRFTLALCRALRERFDIAVVTNDI
jgi:hypothetical protein